MQEVGGGGPEVPIRHEASVIGGGGEILGPPSNGRIHESYPASVQPPDGGWTVGLTNLTASTVTGRAYAICKQ